MLDRIIEFAGDDVMQISVCTPYFDPEGEALASLSHRMAVPVKTYLQRNHVGLSVAAATALPNNVELTGIDTEPSRFIHANFTRSSDQDRHYLYLVAQTCRGPH